MGPENSSPMPEQPESNGTISNKFAELRERVEFSNRKTQEIAKATKALSGIEAVKAEVHHTVSEHESFILKNRAKTKAHERFHDINNALERATKINREVEIINRYVIVSDDTMPNINNSEVTISKFCELFEIKN